ncbi:MAG: glycosyltransferase family 4 protein [Methylococcaceae bacterium]|nr:glycosyltransferase family 4 protein [Methylococcaceae bacterium]
MKAVKVVVISSEHTNATWRWIDKHFENVDWFFYRAHPGNKFLLPFQRLFASFQAVMQARRSDIIVSHGPYMAFYCAVLLWCFRIRTPHIVYAFNFAELPVGFALKRMQFAFKKINKLVVSSTMEIGLYSDYFKIPYEQFDFVRWGVKDPRFEDSGNTFTKNYICAVGGNARDYRTFMFAMKELPEIPAVVVVRPHNLIGLEIPQNVTVLTNIPKDEAYSVIAHSQFMVLPLKSNEIPCGHVTIVVAFYLGVPIIVTDSSGISDYVKDHESGLLCLPGSKESMKEKILALWNDPVLRNKLAQSGKAFAALECSEENYVKHFKATIASVVEVYE